MRESRDSVFVVTAVWREIGRDRIRRGPSWCTFLWFSHWQMVYEQRGLYFTGD
jgi:hypothetical protein